MNNAKNTTLFPYLERLLEGEAVEWKTLGEVGTFVRGTSFQKKHFVEKGIGCIHYGEIYTRYGLFAKRTISYLNEEIANKARKAAYGDLIIATTSENDDDVCKSTVWLGTESIVVSNDACYYHHTLNPKYVAYFFRTNEFQKQKRAYITGTKVKRVNANDLAKITIPVPPLRVQARIVEILDKFTQLEAELESELEARKKQYAYYRDQLLNFPQFHSPNVNIEWRTLGEVCDRTKGIKITATQMKAMHKSNAPVKIFAGGQTFALVDYNDLPPKDIYFFPSIIVKSRGIIEFEYYDKPFSHKSELWSYHTSSPDVNAKFLYYYLKTREDHFQQLGSVMQMPQISIPATENFPIPLPLSPSNVVLSTSSTASTR